MERASFCLLGAVEDLFAGGGSETIPTFWAALGRRFGLLRHGLNQGLDGRLLKAWRASKMPLAKLVFLAVIEDAVRTESSAPKGFCSIDDDALLEMVERFVGDPERGPAAAPAEGRVA